METLRTVLQRHAGSPVTMGAHRAAKANDKTNFDRQNLQRDLARISKRNEKYFMVGIAMAIVLFIALVIIAFLHQSNSITAQAVPPVLGSSAAVIVWRMFRMWREKSYTDCVLALVPSVDDEMLKTIIAVLVQKI